MTTAISLTSAQRQLVLDTLAVQLPPGTKVWVFGSRANGRARRYSDLDLLIDAGRRLTLDESAILSEAFDESDLPYKVDLIDWHAIGDRFRDLIATQRVPLNHAAASAEASATPGNRL